MSIPNTMDYEITIKFEPADDAESVVAHLFEVFNSIDVGTEAVAGFLDGAFEVAYLIGASSLEEALVAGRRILADGMTAMNIDLKPIGIHVVEGAVEDETPELQPA